MSTFQTLKKQTTTTKYFKLTYYDGKSFKLSLLGTTFMHTQFQINVYDHIFCSCHLRLAQICSITLSVCRITKWIKIIHLLLEPFENCSFKICTYCYTGFARRHRRHPMLQREWRKALAVGLESRSGNQSWEQCAWHRQSLAPPPAEPSVTPVPQPLHQPHWPHPGWSCRIPHTVLQGCRSRSTAIRVPMLLQSLINLIYIYKTTTQ